MNGRIDAPVADDLGARPAGARRATLDRARKPDPEP
jgi:hypothetical protein